MLPCTCFCGAAYLGNRECDAGSRCPRIQLGRGSWHEALHKLLAMGCSDLAQKYPGLSLVKLGEHVALEESDEGWRTLGVERPSVSVPPEVAWRWAIIADADSFEEQLGVAAISDLYYLRRLAGQCHSSFGVRGGQYYLSGGKPMEIHWMGRHQQAMSIIAGQVDQAPPLSPDAAEATPFVAARIPVIVATEGLYQLGACWHAPGRVADVSEGVISLGSEILFVEGVQIEGVVTYRWELSNQTAIKAAAEALQTLMSLDQGRVSNLKSGEMLCRRRSIILDVHRTSDQIPGYCVWEFMKGTRMRNEGNALLTSSHDATVSELSSASRHDLRFASKDLQCQSTINIRGPEAAHGLSCDIVFNLALKRRATDEGYGGRTHACPCSSEPLFLCS